MTPTRTLAGSSTTPTLTRDIAPILSNRCVTCHRPGAIAPMSLISYEDVRPWAKSVRAKVTDREMPLTIDSRELVKTGSSTRDQR